MRACARLGLLAACAWPLAARAADPPATDAPAAADQAATVGEVFVTGFRQSLASSMQVKRNETEVVDVITAEDIARFPDLNLAEALQRIPGVAIDRDGGEGRSITVRGLSNDFSQVKINGLEALATTGGKDEAGGANRTRGFDFQVFASELFNRATVRKTASAEQEEGSLGAAIDLRTARPFDYDHDAFAMGVQAGYNDLSGSFDPRATVLASHTFLDGKLGVLVSGAYSARRIFEDASSSGRWENPEVPTNSAGCFRSPGPCNSPPGIYSDVNSAWHARLPRYGRLDYDWRRYGATGTVQYRPTETTDITLDGLYAWMGGTRDEDYLEIISLSRSGKHADAETDVRDYTIDSKDELIAATFDGVDARSEDRHDVLSTQFYQFTANLDQRIGERFRLKAMAGRAKSVQDNPVQTTASLDRYNTNGYRYDFTGDQRLPSFDFGFDVTDPAAWSFSPTSDKGDASLIRMRPNKTVNGFKTFGLDLAFEVAPWLTLKAGVLDKIYDFTTQEERRYTINGVTDGAVPLPPGVTVADISNLFTGFGAGLGVPAGTPTSWLSPDVEKIARLFDIYCNCINQYGDFRLSLDNQLTANRAVREDDLGLYVQADFDTQLFGMRLKGDAGLRRVRTHSVASGYTGATLVSVPNTYDDYLPALNLALEPSEKLVIRFGAGKQMSRPELPFVTPGGSISNTARTLTIGNPLLEPIRAWAYDLSVEWYPERETMISGAVFFKDLTTYIQTSAATMAFGATGLPPDILSNGNTPDTVFEVSQYLNTPGGKLTGFEISVQRPFTFLPGWLAHFGGIFNYTRTKAHIRYITDSSTTPPTTTVFPLVGLSPSSWNATLYYEDGRLSARLSAAYRGAYFTQVPGGNGNDAIGKEATFNLDAAASYAVTKRVSLTFEAINLTDRPDDRWISSDRKNSQLYSHTGREYYLGARYRF